MGRHSHLRVVPPLPAPAAEERRGATRHSGQGRPDPRAPDRLRARTRASLDGWTVDDIDTRAAGIREKLDRNTRRPAAGSGTAAAPRTALAAHDEVLAWLVDTDTCVYHGQLG